MASKNNQMILPLIGVGGASPSPPSRSPPSLSSPGCWANRMKSDRRKKLNRYILTKLCLILGRIGNKDNNQFFKIKAKNVFYRNFKTKGY